MVSASVAKKILAGVILLVDKEKLEKLFLDQVATKFLNIVGQVSFSLLSQAFVFTFCQFKALTKSCYCRW